LLKSTITKRLVGVLAAVALSLGLGVGAGASAPAAAAGTVWDRVAKCESGGNWKINTGNGFYGGLQFSSRTWAGFGGKKYASKAHKATKAEQVAIARRVLAAQGPGAWPTCSRKAGLTKSNGKASKSATASSSKPSAKKSTKVKKKSTAKKSSAKATAKKTIKVRSGDTLAKIAKRHHVKGGWKGLWKLNKKTVKNPNSLHGGQKLKIRK
jgi:resuscitation-promoting factor RpfA